MGASSTSAAMAFAARSIDARAAAASAGRPLLSVSCSSASACTAVGGVFADRWNGRRWLTQSVRAPAFSAPAFSFLGGVACPTGSACMAVGLERAPLAANVSYDFSALALHWEGTSWSDRSPAIAQTRNAFLLGVSCPSASDCIAVGQQGTSALAMRWRANRWRVELAPAAPPVMSILNGVSCMSATDCIAVGSTAPNQLVLPRALIEHWNGRDWSIMRAPTTSALVSTSLNAVTCVRGSCTAVGSVGFAQLVERFNGHAWSIQPAPAGVTAVALNGVSCVSSTDCVAVGGRDSPHQSIAENWNGARWSVVRTPSLAGGSLLWAVSCPAPSVCFAAGSRNGSPLLERFNGTNWSTQTVG